MNLNLIEIVDWFGVGMGKTANICIVSFYGGNRSEKVNEAQRNVFSHFGIKHNQLAAPFPQLTHGEVVDNFIARFGEKFDYLYLMDNDCIPINKDFINLIHEKIKDKKTIAGGVHQSNHIYVNGSKNHPYCSSSCLFLSMDLYKNLGRPSFNHNETGDTAENLTWQAEELGYNVLLFWPSHLIEKTYEVGPALHFGLGTTYSNLLYHQTCANDPRSEQMFVDKCESIINGNN